MLNLMTTLHLLRAGVAALLVAGAAPPALGEVKLPGILGSHMVVQRDLPLHFWGWAAPDEKVSVAFHGITRETTADRLGSWNVWLPPEPAGGPYQLTVTGANAISLDDILVGDVWFASGQSNMEMPLRGWTGAPVNRSAEEIAAANQPNIRLLPMKQRTSEYPLRDNDSAWTVCTPATAANFSAVAYLFGKEIAGRERVPIGLIDSTWGGTVIEAWFSLGAIGADASLMPAFATRARMMDEQADVPAILAADSREDAAAKQAGRTPAEHMWWPNPSSWAPAALFNGMIAPATPFPIKGVIWYQGESNSKLASAPLYARLLPALINDWRAQWREGNFPFLYVQIANFKSNATEAYHIVREAQRRTLSVANTAMAVTIDVGNPDNVHPADKQTVAARLALAARALAYGEKVEYSGPLFRQATPDAKGVRLWFDHVSGGLQARGGDLRGFEVAGDDRAFVSASARIDGATVLVTSPRVAAPKYVRYGWSNSPEVNLFNSAGLPASPFTSEDAIPTP
jgi:sialate O-acetylesterase